MREINFKDLPNDFKAFVIKAGYSHKSREAFDKELEVIYDFLRDTFPHKNTQPRVVISQPMAGMSTEEIQEKRREVVKKLNDEGFTVVNTVFNFGSTCDYISSKNFKNKSLYYLVKSLEEIAKADVVYFMRGWEEARGCVLEHACCVAYGVPVVYEKVL